MRSLADSPADPYNRVAQPYYVSFGAAGEHSAGTSPELHSGRARCCLRRVGVNIGPGVPGQPIVGSSDTAVQEAREWVRAAIRTSGAKFPLERLSANLAPADLAKQGLAYDLPVALGILLASGQVVADFDRVLAISKSWLDKSLRHTAGVLPMVGLAQERDLRRAFVLEVTRHLQHLVAQARLPGVGFHDLRHTTVSLCLGKAGASQGG